MKKRLILIFAIAASAFVLLSCSPAQPAEEEARALVMSEYNCEEEPVLENSYDSDDSYTFEYDVEWTTPDGFINIYVPVSVYYYLDSEKNEWVYSYLEETGEEKYSLNEDGLVGTWEGTGIVQTSALDLTNLIDPDYDDKIDRVGVSLKITSVEGSDINYELSVDEPAIEGSEWDYSSEGSYHLYLDAQSDEYYVLWNDDQDPLLASTLTTRNWSGTHANTTSYGFQYFSYKYEEDNNEMVLKAYHGGEGKDITLTKTSE